MSHLPLHCRVLWHRSGRFVVFCLLNTNSKSDRYMCWFGDISVRKHVHPQRSDVWRTCMKGENQPIVCSVWGNMCDKELHVSCRSAVRFQRQCSRRGGGRRPHSCQPRHSEITLRGTAEEERVTFSWWDKDQKLRDMSSNSGRGKSTTQAVLLWWEEDSCFYDALKQAVKLRLDFTFSWKNKTLNLVQGTLSWQHKT